MKSQKKHALPLSLLLGPSKNGRHFSDDIFRRIFLNENIRISNNFLPNYVS